MRVCVDARSVRTTDDEVRPVGGIGRHLFKALEALLALDTDLSLRMIVGASNRRAIFADNPRVTEVRYAPAANSWRGFIGLSHAVAWNDVDLFHAPANVLPLAVPRPSVVTIHDLMWLTHPQLCSASPVDRWTVGEVYRQGLSHALRRARWLLTVSHASAREIERVAPHARGRITVAYPGADDLVPLAESDAWRVVKGLLPRATPFILVVGQGSPYKNHLGAVAAFLKAFEARPELKLVLVRRFDRFDWRMARQLRTHAAQERVIGLCEVTARQLHALYSVARCLLFPSLMEGFGLPPLEAMAYGVPVVTSDRSSMAEVGVDAVVQVDPTSIESIVHGLTEVEADAGLRERLVTRGKERAADFQWRTCAERILDAYRNTLCYESRR